MREFKDDDVMGEAVTLFTQVAGADFNS